MATEQIKKVLMFAVTLANCGAKAAADSSSLARAADFLPLIEDVPGLTTLNGPELKAEWMGMTLDDRKALVDAVAVDLNVGSPALNAAVDTFLDIGLDLASAIGRGVAAAATLK
jgi:hypothetical protein